VVEAFAAEMRPLGTANFLYSDGEFVFGHGHRRTQADGTMSAPGLWGRHRRRAARTAPLMPPAASGIVIHADEQPQDTVQEMTVLASVPVTGGQWSPLAEGEIVNPALLTTENRLSFRFAMKGAGANARKLVRDRSIWLNVGPSTFIYLGATQLPLADNLGFLPRPFADSKDPLPLKLPFLLPADPEPGVLKAAGMVAAYFGLVAQNKGATFPVQFDGVPAGNAVALVLGGRYPAGVAPIPGEGPRVAVVANPVHVDSKLLLIVGADTAELQAAAATLAVGPGHLTGGWSAAYEPLPPPREAYDAPKWISNSPAGEARQLGLALGPQWPPDHRLAAGSLPLRARSLLRRPVGRQDVPAHPDSHPEQARRRRRRPPCAAAG
jgi:hypothetical protein